MFLLFRTPEKKLFWLSNPELFFDTGWRNLDWRDFFFRFILFCLFLFIDVPFLEQKLHKISPRGNSKILKCIFPFEWKCKLELWIKKLLCKLTKFREVNMNLLSWRSIQLIHFQWHFSSWSFSHALHLVCMCVRNSRL